MAAYSVRRSIRRMLCEVIEHTGDKTMHLYWQMLYTKLAREKAEDEAILRGIKQSNLQTVLFLAHLNRLYPLAAQPIRVQ